MYIKIEKNPDGGHEYQDGGIMGEGWAAIPEDMELPSTFPYVDIEVALVTHPEESWEDSVGNPLVVFPSYTQMEVTKMTAGEQIPVSEEPGIPVLETRVETLEAKVDEIAAISGEYATLVAELSEVYEDA